MTPLFGHCAFCGSYRPMTEEDVFARWMNPILRRDIVKNHQRGMIHMVPNNSGYVTPLQVSYRRPGHAASLKLCHFCANCNNGFMSDLENKNKAVLTSLVCGHNFFLTPYMVRNLVGWIAKTTMVLEYFEPDRLVTAPAERSHLMNTRLPPDQGWNIWIAPYEGPQWITRVFHHALHLVPKNLEGHIPDDRSLNTQSTMFVVGHVVFYVISSHSKGHVFELGNERLADFRRIWPRPKGVEAWPRGRYLEKGDLVRMIDSFNVAVGLPRLRLLD